VSLSAFLDTVVRALDEAGLSYMLTGSLAAAYYATPRATQDVDIVVEAERASLDRFVRLLLDAGFYVSLEAAEEALRSHGQFNAIDPDRGWKVDFIIRKDRPFSRSEFERRHRKEILGIEVSIARLEDIVIAKLEWARMGDSELQRRDALQLIERRWDDLDRAYVERWADDLGLADEWRALVERL
jgi:predicted nucleotidyltransferase